MDSFYSPAVKNSNKKVNHYFHEYPDDAIGVEATKPTPKKTNKYGAHMLKPDCLHGGTLMAAFNHVSGAFGTQLL